MREPWTKAADETLIDLIMKYGPTIECAIIAESTLRKQRKDIYHRFRYLMKNYSDNNRLTSKYRKVQLMDQAEKLRESTISEQVLEFHKNILNDSASSGNETARSHKRLNSAPVVAHKSNKQLKLIEKLSLLEPTLIDPSFLKTEIKRSLPSFSKSTNVGDTRLERINHSLDEIIFQRCLPRKMNAKFNFDCNSISEHLDLKGAKSCFLFRSSFFSQRFQNKRTRLLVTPFFPTFRFFRLQRVPLFDIFQQNGF